jgi:methanogenic corrinoid protein MtbC1
VAQEHYCTAATQLIMSQLYPHIFAGERNGRRLVAACVGEELHELGIRMVADFFEMEGWDTYYLGANAPTASILDSLDEYDADLLALSTTILSHVAQIREIIEQVHHRERGNGVKILVGGYPFNVSPELWRKVGADGYAVDAQEAIQAANELVSENE